MRSFSEKKSNKRIIRLIFGGRRLQGEQQLQVCSRLIGIRHHEHHLQHTTRSLTVELSKQCCRTIVSLLFFARRCFEGSQGGEERQFQTTRRRKVSAIAPLVQPGGGVEIESDKGNPWRSSSASAKLAFAEKFNSDGLWHAHHVKKRFCRNIKMIIMNIKQNIISISISYVGKECVFLSI